MTTPIDLAGLIARLRDGRYRIGLPNWNAEHEQSVFSLLDEAADALEAALAVTEPFAKTADDDYPATDIFAAGVTEGDLRAARDFRAGIIKERT